MPARLLALILAALLAAPAALASEQGAAGESATDAAQGDDKESAEEAAEDDKPEDSYADIVEASDRYEGLFDLYRDRETGAVHLSIAPEQLDQPFLYFVMTDNGPVQGGHFRGAYREDAVVTLRRHFDRIEFIEQNTRYYFDPDNAISRAADANISPAVLAVQKIVAEDEDSGRLLIKADDIFLKESLHQVKAAQNPDLNPKEDFVLGSLSSDKNKIYDLRSYPDNTELFVEYVYENPAPLVAADEPITDSRYVSVRVQHSFVRMPDNDYRPRFDDHRVGYFTERVTDLTSDSHTPYRDLIKRWHLVKKNPDAEVSDPVEPIVFWIENTTPVAWRDLIRDAALAWNSAFEKAGFSNAIEVRVQPDDADWDAGDIRYNVLRWKSSPQPPFGGYGPSFSNPLTGQIIGADIMLEYSMITNTARALRTWDNTLGGDAGHGAGLECSLGHGLSLNGLFADQAMRALDADPALREQLVHDTMHYLILHEIGHTLGLNHNMRASQLLSPDEAFDAEAIARSSLAGSVMDYPAINFAPPGMEQTQFYSVRPGPYDDWAIEFGYSPDVDDPQRREALLARSTEPALAFGNDADDMRSPGKAIDPRVNIFDMSSDPITYVDRRLDLVAAVTGKLRQRYGTPGESYQALHDGYRATVNEQRRAATVLSRYIGGVHVNRAVVGQPGAETPLVPVAAEEQRRAMRLLADRVFAPGAIEADPELYRHLQQQRRGFDFFEDNEDPKLHDMALAVQTAALDHLLHPAVQKRITDSRLYGNEYPLDEVMQDLTEAVFRADLREPVSSVRQNLQTEYVNRLIGMVGDGGAGYDHVARAVAFASLENIREMLEDHRGANAETRAHRGYLLHLIRRGLDEQA